MKKKGKNILDSKIFVKYATAILFVVAGFLTAIIFGSNKSQKQNLANALNKNAGECSAPAGSTCDGGPAHSKIRTSNHDGTYKLHLDVKGEASTTTSTPNANILIVYDTSGSMKAHVEQSDGAWGHATDNYQSLGWGQLYTRRTVANSQACPSPGVYNTSSGTRYCYTPISDGYTGNDTLYIHTWSNNNAEFGSGFTAYSNYDSNLTRYGDTTRGQNAEKVAHDFSEALLGYNTQAEPDNVQMALVTFNTSVTTQTTRVGNQNQVWTSSNSYLDHFASDGTSTELTYEGYTNWEQALQSAQTVLRSADGDPTFVVFITDGAPTVYSGHTGQKYNPSVAYPPSRDDAYNVNNYQTVTNGNGSVNAANSNTQLFAIYAYGDEADYLDDLVYYAYHNAARPAAQGGETAATVETENYFNAMNTADLNAAITTIFQSIASTLGVGDVSINDGTTSHVTTTTNTVAHLLEVDESSFEYWLSMPANGNKVTRVDPISGDTIEINLTDNGDGTITASSDAWGTDGSVTVTGTLALNTFKYKWTGKNNLYNYNPPAAVFDEDTGAVTWDLEPVGTLLNDVTYTVTFDVYPSQETYDMIANLRNGIIEYDDLDANIRKYLHYDEESDGYTLETNTLASLTYSDTRPESATSGKTVYYSDLDGEELVSSKINIEKVWEHDSDSSRPYAVDEDGNPVVLDMYLIKDGVKTNEKITVTHTNNAETDWKDSTHIATGLLRTRSTVIDNESTGDKHGTIQVLDPGHDYSLEEPSVISYHWELTMETTHPMIIDGTLSTLVEVTGEDIPEAVQGDAENTYRKIGSNTYYKFKFKDSVKVYLVKSTGTTADLKAYNNRKSYIEFKKNVTGDAPAGKEFNFTFYVDNKIASNEAVENSNVWFSVYDTVKGETVMEPTITSDNGYTRESKDGAYTGYYYVPTKSTVTIKLQDGWNLRVINLGTGSTYTISETGVTSGTTLAELETSNPKYFRFDHIDAESSLGADYTKWIVSNSGATFEGKVTEPDSSYSLTYENQYPGTYVTAEKNWVVEDITTVQDKTIEVQLYQQIKGENSKTPVVDKNGNNVTAELNKDNNWKYTFEGLPLVTQEEEPRQIEYFVEETGVQGYTTSIVQGKADATGAVDNHIWVVTNIEQTDLEVTKIWNDANNQDGKRPNNITLTLKANGKVVEIEQPEAVKNGNTWTFTYTGLDKYTADGELITYTVTESNYAPTYYSTEDEVAKESNEYTITNTHTPEKISISGSKVWSDANNQDGLRPQTITVTLTGNNGYTSTKVVQKGENNDWAFSFTDLDKYKDGVEIVYTLTETRVDGYEEPSVVLSSTLTTDTAKVYTVTNTHTPEVTSVTATKVWDDADNQDGVRPTEIEFRLLADGQPVLDDDKQPIVVTLNANTVDEEGNWIYTWSNLPKYAGTTTPIVYTVEEVTDLTTIDERDYGYDAPTYGTITVDGEEVEDKLTIINKRVPETVNIPVEKIWDDSADVSNRISVTVQLKADGNNVEGKTTTLSADTWKSSFDNLPKYKDGVEIEYSIEETTSVPGYSAPTYSTTEDGTLQVTNKLITTTVSGQKQWNDGFNDSNRPETLSVNLLRDGTIIDTKVITVDDDNWSYEWTNLPTHVSGSAVEYSVSEEVPVGYTSEVVGYNITNTLITVEVPVTKAWAGDNGLEANRPESITVSLMANGNLVEGKTLTLSDDNDWSDKFVNLPKFMDGNEEPVVYTVVEGEVAGYTGSVSEATTTTVNGVETISYTITNTLDRTSITVHKDWDDANDQDGKRPGSITVSLNYGELTLTLDESNNWTDTFENLPVYVNKTAYQYEVTEAQVSGYDEPVVGNLVKQEDGTYKVEITNTHTPETITIQGSKVWDDANNQDGLRNDDTVIVVTLTSNDGEDPRTLRVPKGENNDWAFSFSGLPKYKDGVEIVYTLTEAQVQGYEEPVVVLSSTLSTADVKVYTITNKHEPGKTSVTVHKVWEDADDQDGLRAPSIDVQLLADGNPVEGKTATLDESNGWTYTFADLKEFDGTTTPVVYTFEETTTVTGYEEPEYSVNENTGVLEVTNKHVPSETSVTVHKVWDDADNQDGLRAPSIDVQLLADGNPVEGKTATLDESNKWTYTFDKLPEFAGTKTPIVYTFEETESVTGYEDPEYSVNEETGVLEVTNKHTPAVTSVTATKIWDDSNNQDGKRPEAIQFQLYADETAVDGELVTLTANTVDKDGNWTYTWSNLPKYAGTTTPIVYTVEEVTDLTKAGYSAPTYSEDKLTVTNSRETEKVNISVNKVWADNNNQDGLQPGSVEVTLHSKTAAEESATDEESVTLSSNNRWTNSWTNLPKYRDGKEITYSITETTTAVITGTDKEGEYAIKVEQNTTENNIAFTVTNTHTPITTEASVKKVWDDNNDQDGVRPTSLTIQLLADGQVVEGKTVTIDANNLEGTITGLPKYNKSTTPIVYSWRETNLTSDYELTDTKVSGTTTTLTNTHTPETTSITATKIWSDNNNQDGLRNENTKVTFELYADGESTGKTITLSGDPAENRYSDSFTGLPVYRDHGTEIVYTVKEVVVPNGYEASAVGNKEAIGNKENSYTITNTHETETISISVLKKWSDNNNQDGLRNANTTVTFQLYANGTAVEGKTVTLTEANKWADSFSDLDKKANGQDIVYTVKEVEVPNGYEASAVGNDTATGTAENNYTITNTHTPEEIEVTVKKVWDDADDQDGLRSKANYSITLTGTREDGTTITIKNATVDLTPSVSSYTYKNLPKYDGGQLVTYTAEETTVPAGYEDSYSEDTLTITNTHTPATDAVVVTKVWDDEDNRDGIRPENITINLLADGTKVTGVTPKIVKDGNTWTFTYEGLPVYKDHGTEIVYTATEENVEDYIGHPDGLTIRNEHPHETIDIPVTKQWVDANDQDGKRPTSIQIDLYADGTKYDSITLTKDANASSENPNLWEGVFTDLPKYKEGEEGEPIEYTIKEVSSVLDGETPLYTGTINDFDIINEHIPSKKSISVTKVWSDADDQDGMRETSVTVYLYKNGEKQEDTKQVLDESNKWTYTWENLPEYENGDIITYYVDEASVPEGYSKKVETEDQLNYTITNSHTPIEITISGTKTWEDADDQDGQRPESITVKVLKGEEVVDTITVTPDEEGNWTYESKKLPKFEGGNEIKYTVVEEKVEGYETVIPEGEYNITNKHTPETVEYVITKSWEDAEDNDAIRPESITVKLLADGEVIKTVKVSGPEWTYTFGPLDKNKGGKAIKYTIEEEAVPGYVLVRSEPVVTNKTITEVLTNKHTPEPYSINGKKTWVDENNKDGKRPTYITVYVYADGKKIAELTVDANSNWEYELNGLYKYNHSTTPIVYTIEELPVEGYETEYEGFDITNILTDVEGEKEEFPPDTYAKDQSTYRIDFLVMLLAGYILTSYRRVIKE